MRLKKKENLLWFYVLSFTWGIIWTIIGLLSLLAIIVFAKSRVEISNYRGRILVYFKNGNWGGASLGIVILASSKGTRLLNHELGHSIQNTFMGPLFIFLVAIPSGIRYQLFSWLSERHKAKHGVPLDYYGIWFEKQASTLGDKHDY